MTATKKAGIVVLVVILLVAAGLIPYFATRPRFVPTIGKIVYLSDLSDPGHQHVWISGPNGEDARELTRGPEHDAGPVFSPSGSQIAYISDKSGDPQVYEMDADGQNSHAITIGSDSKSQPEFTPDGNSVSYITRGVLTLVNVRSHDTESILPQEQESATSATTQALSQEVRASILRYAWQPGQSSDLSNAGVAAVEQAEDGSQELVLLPKPDASPVPVAVGAVISLTWSPDGGRMAAAVIGLNAYNPGPMAAKSLPPGQQLAPIPKGRIPSGVFMFDAEGGIVPAARPLGLLVGSAGGPQNPSFSADGTTVAFECWPTAIPDASKILGIAQQAADGSHPMDLFLKGPVTDFQWAPDGVHFSFNMSNPHRPDKADLCVVDTGAHKLINLTKGAAYATGGNWSPQIANE